ncbi:MAG: YaaR family protein [Treponema sp.]|jgi:uncharacterized protein YaaR (DUF327 family)|nr:YaaR family protein [Treponema sp.]
MDKIDIPGGGAPVFTPPSYAARTETRKPRGKEGVKKNAFSRLLGEVREAEETLALDDYPPSEEALQELLDDVHSAGDALRLRPLAEEIKHYKQAVRQFLYYVVANGYSVKTENYLFNHEKRRKVQIAVVDQKLEQLAAGILSGQIGQVDILARLDEITGLLVDLMQ